MDCLDRTNVVQGVFSRYIAHEQLQLFNLLPKPVNTKAKRSPFERFPVILENAFREGWTNNADAMSYLYTGTPALKTDFTRTGKRTYRGAMDDGINSVTRYYINNFTDGYYHDCLDIATLKLSPQSKLKSRTQVGLFKASLVAIIFLTIIANMFVRNYLLQIVEEELTTKHTILHHLVVFGTFFAGLYCLYSNGRKFIDDCTRFV